MELQLQGKIVRLRTKSMSILSKIPNGLCKISAKTSSKVAGEDGIDSDIDFKKKGINCHFPRGKIAEKKFFPHGNWQWPIPS